MSQSAANTVRGTPGALFLTLGLLLIPAALLGGAAFRYDSMLLAIGCLGHLLGSALLIRSRMAWRPPTSAIAIALYLIALGWLWFATSGSSDWLAYFGRGLLLLGAVVLLFIHDVLRTGVEPRRRAKTLNRQILNRALWPQTAEEYCELPEVRSLFSVVRDDPSLAFELLRDPRHTVQFAGLTALQNRSTWRWDEATVVLEFARRSNLGEVRTLALRALATAPQNEIVEGIASFLGDPSESVRIAATESLLTGGGSRWALVRESLRAAMADPLYANEGALPGAMGRLSKIALCDLTSWTAEPGPICERSVRTLVEHYDRLLQSDRNPGLVHELGQQVTAAQTPPVLRVELAALLRKRNVMPAGLLDRMTDPDQPSPIRLIAVEKMLEEDPTETSALNVLRGLARQPNRETALAVARILQRYLRLDFGLPSHGATERQMNEASKKVFRWSMGEVPFEPTETPGPRGALRQNPAAAAIPAKHDDDDDALGGHYPAPADSPASAPGMSGGRFKPRR